MSYPRVPVRVVKRGPVPPPAAAWVPWPRLVIFAAPRHSGDVGLMAHELRHVEQAERHGARWPLAYVAQWARSGFRYRDMPYEVDARAAAKEPHMRQWAAEVIAANDA